ncbi:MAG: ABC transporter permease [Anaerolineaceae bacterium]|nr:ABC transporter permease [Anaerolineaceae bacterium]
MSKPTVESLRDIVNIIWTIASKDIVDALKNKVVVSMIIVLSIMLFVPKMLPLLFEQVQTPLPIYDMGDSSLLTELRNNSDISVQVMHSEQELRYALCSSMYPLIGLLIPEDFDQNFPTDAQVELQGYVCWGKRYQVSELQPKLEEMLSRSLGRSVFIHIEGNILYPPSDGFLYLSMATVNSVLMILMMGIFLVPSLLFEEKETKTIQALLVSPASIGQVVVGKALAGSFYILVTALMIFTISWTDVIHWNMVVLFVISGGIFSVAVGLILGSFYEKQLDMVGWMPALLILLVGSVLVIMLGTELPKLAENILPWVPSVALAEIYRTAFSETIPFTRVLNDLWIVLSVSLPLYAIVIWKIRRSDR